MLIKLGVAHTIADLCNNVVDLVGKERAQMGSRDILATALVLAALLCTTDAVCLADSFIKLNANFARPGVEIGMLEDKTIQPITATQRLAVRASGTRVILNLQDLKGFVTIDSSNQALDIVRLRTSWRTAFSLGRKVVEAEVMECTQTPQQPTYGLKDEQGVTDADGQSDPKRSGYWAVLSKQAFEEGRFVTPSVRSHANGYEILRWVFIEDYRSIPRICEVLETVGHDGSYSQRVLREESPPTLTHTRWEIPEQE